MVENESQFCNSFGLIRIHLAVMFLSFSLNFRSKTDSSSSDEVAEACVRLV